MYSDYVGDPQRAAIGIVSGTEAGNGVEPERDLGTHEPRWKDRLIGNSLERRGDERKSKELKAEEKKRDEAVYLRR